MQLVMVMMYYSSGIAFDLLQVEEGMGFLGGSLQRDARVVGTDNFL